MTLNLNDSVAFTQGPGDAIAKTMDVSKSEDGKKNARNSGTKPRSSKRKSKVSILWPPSPAEDAVHYAAGRALHALGKGLDAPVQLVDLGRVDGQVELWKSHLPQVRPHYAVKCSPDKQLIKTLHAGGCGFDCATANEIELVLALGVNPGDIVYSHPCKPRSHIAFAKEKGVSLMSFDNAVELRKVATEFPKARLLLRLVCEDAGAQCPMSCKFGASREIWPELLAIVKELNLRLEGVSFHVGSGCKDPESFEKALEDAKDIFDMATGLGMEPLRVLDIGGGFPGDAASFMQIGPVVAEKLGRLFSKAEFPELQIIAEPGRFFACSTAHLLTKVYAKATVPDAENGEEAVCRYYLNDGLYGSFNCIIYDHVSVHPEPLENSDRPEATCAMFGPTCDGFDVVMERHKMPELEEGDWILWRNMGAYTSAAGSGFNGFPKAQTWYYRFADTDHKKRQGYTSEATATSATESTRCETDGNAGVLDR